MPQETQLNQAETKDKILPPLDFVKYINEYNTRKNAKIPPNQTFGLRSLEEDFRKDFDTFVEIINQEGDFIDFTEEEKEFHKKKQEKLRNLRIKAWGKNFKVGRIIEPHEEAVNRNVNEKARTHDWMKVKKNYLNQNLRQLLATYQKKNALLILNEWEQLSYTSMLSNEHLSLLAGNIVPGLSRLLKAAFKDLKANKSNMPKSIFNDYHSYLLRIQTGIDQLKRSLSFGMWYRLNQVDKNSTFTNCVKIFIDKLIYFRIISIDFIKPEDAKILEKNDPITNSQFQSFVQYIEKNGSKEVKDNLHSLSYYTNSRLIPFNFIQGKKSRLIPEQFQDEAPLYKKKPLFLFKGHNTRQQFFKDMDGFILQINKPVYKDMNLISLSDVKNIKNIFNSLTSNRKNIRQALKKNQEKLTDFSSSLVNRVFRKKTIDFMHKWNDMLVGAEAKEIENKVALLESIGNRLVTLSQTQELNLRFPFETVLYVNNKIKKLKEAIVKKEKYKLYNERIKQLSTNLSPLNINIDNVCVILQCKQDKLITNENLKKYKESISQFTQEARIAFLSKFGQQLAEAFVGLKASVKAMVNNPFDEKNEQLIGKLANHYYVLWHAAKELNETDAIFEMKKMLPRIFIYFLQEVLANRLTDIEKIEHFENFFLEFGDSAQFLGKPLNSYMKKLQDSRRNNGKTVYQIDCSVRANALANELISKRFNKELDVLDKNINQALEDDEFNLKGRLKPFFDKRDNMVKRNIITINQIRDEITPSMETLLGIKDKKYEPIGQLIELSAEVKIVKHKIQDEELNYGQKLKMYKILQESLSRTLQSNRKLKEKKYQGFGLTKKGKRKLFSKIYLEIETQNKAPEDKSEEKSRNSPR